MLVGVKNSWSLHTLLLQDRKAVWGNLLQCLGGAAFHGPLKYLSFGSLHC